MNQLHPGARWQFRLRGYLWFGILGIVLNWMVQPLVIFLLSLLGLDLRFLKLEGVSSVVTLVIILLLFLLGPILVVIIASEIYARMSYNRWFYEFTNEGLRLERGIIWKRYSNIPYDRIQNVDVHRGIIARMFGFSSLSIETAGYSEQPDAEGYIPAVEMKQAEKIRELVMKKITGRRK